MSYERHPLEMDPSIERCSDCGEGLDYCACPDAEKQREFKKRLDDLEAKVDAAKAKRAQVTTREEAAALAAHKHDFEYAPSFSWEIAQEPLRADYMKCATVALAAADAHDLAHGVHRLSLDQLTKALYEVDPLKFHGDEEPVPWEKLGPAWRLFARDKAEAVLSAVVQEER